MRGVELIGQSENGKIIGVSGRELLYVDESVIRRAVTLNEIEGYKVVGGELHYGVSVFEDSVLGRLFGVSGRGVEALKKEGKVELVLCESVGFERGEVQVGLVGYRNGLYEAVVYGCDPYVVSEQIKRMGFIPYEVSYYHARGICELDVSKLYGVSVDMSILVEKIKKDPYIDRAGRVDIYQLMDKLGIDS